MNNVPRLSQLRNNPDGLKTDKNISIPNSHRSANTSSLEKEKQTKKSSLKRGKNVNEILMKPKQSTHNIKDS